MIVPVVSDSTATAFTKSLEGAASKLHAAQVRSTLLQATERAISVGSWFVLASGLVVLSSFLRIVPPVFGRWCLIAPLLGMTAYVVTKTILALRSKPDLGETAERLDLAIHSHNRIATSYEISRLNELSEFARRALIAGLNLMESVKDSSPVLPARSFKPSISSKLCLLAGIVVFAATWIWPHALDKFATLPNPSKQLTGHPLIQQAAQDLKPDISKNPDPMRPQLPTNVAQRKNSHSPAGGPSLRGNEKSQNSATALAAAGQQAPSFAGAAESTPRTDSSNGTHGAHTVSDLKQPDLALNPPSKASAASDSASSDATPGQPVSGALGGKDAGDAAKSPPGNSGSGSGADADAKSGEGQGGKGKGGHSKGKGSGSGDADGEPVSSGKGKGTGHNSLKKSRGVAPEFLGDLDPDTLTGPKLPGPEERTREQISPLPGADTPAAEAPTAKRSEPEKQVSRYDAPAGSRSVVSDYFKALHGKTP
jgi:hypothetical protein